jgi:hypothetical protein
VFLHRQKERCIDPTEFESANYGDCRELAAAVARELGVGVLCVAVLPRGTLGWCRLVVGAGKKLTVCVCTDHGGAVGTRLVSTGEDVDRVAVQCARQAGMAGGRECRPRHAAVHFPHAAKEAGD